MDISQTQKRGYIWLLSVLLILLTAVILWPSPQNKVVTEISDTTAPPPTQDEKKADNTDHNIYTHRHHAHERHYRNQQRGSGTNSPTDTQTIHYTPAPPKEPLQVAMNSADTLTWQLLYGIGPSYARRIVKYRELLGGFIRKEQLMEVYGFTTELYQKISPYVVFDEMEPRKMKINEISLKELSRHPYLDYYQARDIVDFRNRGHLFLEPSDLLAIPTMDTSTLQRIIPYLDFDAQ